MTSSGRSDSCMPKCLTLSQVIKKSSHCLSRLRCYCRADARRLTRAAVGNNCTSTRPNLTNSTESIGRNPAYKTKLTSPTSKFRQKFKWSTAVQVCRRATKRSRWVGAQCPSTSTLPRAWSTSRCCRSRRKTSLARFGNVASTARECMHSRSDLARKYNKRSEYLIGHY